MHVRDTVWLLGALWLVGPAWGQTISAPLVLTPERAVSLALEQNAGVQAARLGPQIADEDVRAAEGAWTPVVSSRLTGISEQLPSESTLTAAQVSTLRVGRTADLTLQQRLPWGTQYEVTWSGGRQSSNSILARFDPALTMAVSARVVQPLLRGRSIDAPRAARDVAVVQQTDADAELQAEIARTTFTVRQAYWDWSFALDVLEVRNTSLALAEDLLRENRRRAEVGAIASVDVIEVEAEVASRQEAVLVASARVRNAEDSLKRMIFRLESPDALRSLERAPIDPVEEVAPVVRAGVSARREVTALQTALEANDVFVQRWANEALPDVSLQLDYMARGVAGTELLRANGIFAPVTGTATRAFSAALADAWSSDFPTWSAQIAVSVPLWGNAARAQHRQAVLERRQNEARLRDAEVAARTEFAIADRDVVTALGRIRLTRDAVTLAAERLDAEQRKFVVGLSTSFFVFQAQRDLALARVTELTAVRDYHVAVARAEAVSIVSLAQLGVRP